MNLNTPITKLPHVKPQIAKRIEKLGIFTLEDLLRHFPARYEDLGNIRSITETTDGEQVTITGQVRSFISKRSWKRKLLISEAIVEDATGYARIVFFGQKFLDQTFQEGKRVRLSGTMEVKDGEYSMASPTFELASREPTHTGRIIGVYPETYGITSKWLRWQIQTILQSFIDLEDPLPPSLLQTYHLPSLLQAFRDIHFPPSADHALIAKKRFAFEDMFFLQLRVLQTENHWKTIQAISLNKPSNEETLLSLLPFELTPDQKKATQIIFDDLSQNHPMNRLLNGDVGSGKTAVALLSALHTAQSGYQCALLAPTEVLALQHFQTAHTLLCESGLSFLLLTHNYRLLIHTGAGGEVQEIKREALLRAIRNNTAHVIIGTHALLQKDVVFSKLALAIIDEQHRFGVKQRAHLQKKLYESEDGLSQTTPHLLTMTATPIPRTLSLAFFGNLEISLLETMPRGRKPIETKIISPSSREKVYAFLKEKIQEGRQCYVILPLVEESDAFVGTKAATAEHERLQNSIFPELRIGLLHGKMKAKEKEQVMKAFKEKELDILVATSVVEVGVDVPNSTIMIIEEAHRFGLSQLHQFRGRIGRGEHQSYCFLFAGDDADGPSRRMKILEKSNNGFVIAEEDLKLRGPGQFFGTQQSGLPDIGMENLTNLRLITFARKEARTLLTEDPSLSQHPLLQKTLTSFDKKIHLE